MKRFIVTGGCGFIGSYLVKRLLNDGYEVAVLDNLLRGDVGRLDDIKGDIEFINIDIRDEDSVLKSVRNCDCVFHLAAINGTENFYKHPELVLDVGVRGILNIVTACKTNMIDELVVASTAEVYQTPAVIPTPEDTMLMLPNSTNPRYSYGGSKIITELIALNYGKDHFKKLQVFRPHNVYGPDMGSKHVIPEFIQRALTIRNDDKFDVLGEGSDTRAFCYVDDIVDGIIRMYLYGEHRNIYHIGNKHEISIGSLAEKILSISGKSAQLNFLKGADGGTARRCPDISKIQILGYAPRVDIETGLRLTYDWYADAINNYTESLI